ncbi:heterokaryon incompatibility protein-domain-containing protein [Xylariaceae sp. FL0255]|nr:heterokaryon incompatibility protein-domain-containing protein [Xylariaceae sp. FL0255]
MAVLLIRGEGFSYLHHGGSSSPESNISPCPLCSLIRAPYFSSTSGWFEPCKKTRVDCTKERFYGVSSTYRLIVQGIEDEYQEAFEIFAVDDTPVYSNVLTPDTISRPSVLDPNILSKASQELLKSWIKQCKCREMRTVLPARLLDLRQTDTVCLVETASMGEHPEYVALSYRWADGQNTCLRASYLSLHDQQPYSNFSICFQDVFRLCKAIGFKYIWIDALCIVQDDDSDKVRELSKMADIYMGSSLTVCISDQDSTQGVLRRPHGTHIYTTNVDSKSSTVYARQFLRNEDLITQSVWSSRGWTLQERALSSRKLILGRHKMTWECFEHRIGEDDLRVRVHHSTNEPINRCYRGHLWDDESPYSSWYAIIEEVTGREFTNPSDKIEAVAGLARQFSSSKTFPAGERYIAGLWAQDTLNGLAWKTVRHGSSSGSLPSDSCMRPGTPSWSWTAGEGAVEFMSLRWGPAARGQDEVYHRRLRDIQFSTSLLNIDTKPAADINPYGAVKFGRVCIKGPLFPLDSLPNRYASDIEKNLRNESPWERLLHNRLYWDSERWQQRAKWCLSNLYVLEIAREVFVDDLDRAHQKKRSGQMDKKMSKLQLYGGANEGRSKEEERWLEWRSEVLHTCKRMHHLRDYAWKSKYIHVGLKTFGIILSTRLRDSDSGITPQFEICGDLKVPVFRRVGALETPSITDELGAYIAGCPDSTLYIE